MVLDCYIVHGNDREKAFTHEDDPRIKDIMLCGGMMSGNGADGSFRGKAYEPLVSELMQKEDEVENSYIWHLPDEEDAHGTALELKEQADALADFLCSVESDAKEQDLLIDDGKPTLSPETIIYQYPFDNVNIYKGIAGRAVQYEYTYQEVQDLELLLRCASERGAVMTVWW